MLKKYVAQILNIYNYIDSLIVVDKEGVVEYFITYRPDIFDQKDGNVINKHILEIYPELTEETSSFFRVLKTGEPIFNEKQKLIRVDGGVFYGVNSTLPIMSDGNVIGAVEVSRYLDSEDQPKNITISLKEYNRTKVKDELYSIDDIVTNDKTMLEIKQKILKVAQTNSSVFIYGATGTGKELVAQAIHRHSERCDKLFISQNCAAIPGTLLESILFGTVKGSYTGAENTKGLFELAQGGTIFLDEINSMEIGIQAKILKVIEEKKIRKIGGSKAKKIDVRIITATNEKPKDLVEKGKLREDLFYRLSVVQLNIPPVKSRRKDIKILINYFINQYNKTMNRKIIGVNEDVEKILYNYSWPGNIRELKNVIESAFNLTVGNLIEERDIPEYLIEREEYEGKIEHLLGKESLGVMVDEYEKRIIEIALEKTKNMVEAAKLLNISKQLLRYKMNKFAI
jgi:arginine utilization regulatory protein